MPQNHLYTVLYNILFLCNPCQIQVKGKKYFVKLLQPPKRVETIIKDYGIHSVNFPATVLLKLVVMMKSVCSSFFFLSKSDSFFSIKKKLIQVDQWSWLIEWWNQFVVFSRILILSPLNWTHNRIIVGKKTVLNALLFEYLRQELRTFIST